MSTGLFGCWHSEQDSWNPHLESSIFPWDVCASWNGKGTSFHSFSRLSQCRVPVYLWAPGCFPDTCIKLLFQERKHEMCSVWLWHLAGGSLFRRVQQIHTHRMKALTILWQAHHSALSLTSSKQRKLKHLY